ncbi:MAG: hypothetical protein AB8B83_09185 [Bdellovibrionales bacterium]
MNNLLRGNISIIVGLEDDLVETHLAEAGLGLRDLHALGVFDGYEPLNIRDIALIAYPPPGVSSEYVM